MRQTFWIFGFCILSLSTVINANEVFEKNADSSLIGLIKNNIQIEPRINFRIFCSRFVQNQKTFDGTCNLKGQFFYLEFNKTLEKILDVNPNENMENLFRYLFANYSAYFRSQFGDNENYTRSLDNFISNMDKLLIKLRTSIKLGRFYDIQEASDSSGFTKTITDIIAFVNEQLFSAQTQEEADAVINKYRCFTDSILCPKTSEVFKLDLTERWSRVPFDTFFRNITANALEYFKDPLLYLDRLTFEKFIEEMGEKGLANTKVGLLHEVIKTKLLKTIEYNYNPESDYKPPVKKSTTTKTTKTTTAKQKVIEVIAVPKAAVISIPLAILFAGIFSAFGAAFILQRLRPVKVHLSEEPRPFTAQRPNQSKQNDVEMKRF